MDDLIKETMSPVYDDTDLEDDLILAFTQGTRKAMVKHMLSKGIPDDVKEQRSVLAALKDMDAQSLSLKRLTVDKASVDSAALIATALDSIGKTLGNTNPFEGASEPVQLPVIDATKIPDPKTVPGETEIGVTNETFDSFITKFEDE